jgi:hypothetical protein
MSRKKCISGPKTKNLKTVLRVPSSMRVALVFVFIRVATAQQPDAREIIRRSIAASEHNWRIARNYTFLQRTEERQIDSAGQVKSNQVKTHDVTLLEGSPYFRLTERDDHPLPPGEEKKEQDKLDKSIAARLKETSAQRERRIHEFEQRRERQRADMAQVPEAFDFRIVGEERMEGCDTWVLDAMPRRDYQPRTRDTKILPHVKGRLWIDRQTFQWVKLEAEVIDTVSWGLFLIRLDPGAHIRFEQVHVNDEVWLPSQIAIKASARLGIFKRLRVEENTTYRNYRKFQTDSRLVVTH